MTCHHTTHETTAAMYHSYQAVGDDVHGEDYDYATPQPSGSFMTSRKVILALSLFAALGVAGRRGPLPRVKKLIFWKMQKGYLVHFHEKNELFGSV